MRDGRLSRDVMTLQNKQVSTDKHLDMLRLMSLERRGKCLFTGSETRDVNVPVALDALCVLGSIFPCSGSHTSMWSAIMSESFQEVTFNEC